MDLKTLVETGASQILRDLGAQTVIVPEGNTLVQRQRQQDTVIIVPSVLAGVVVIGVAIAVPLALKRRQKRRQAVTPSIN